ncbi:MAG: ATP-binding protein [Corynebacterium sp.]|uniref:AAA family ATPase n=1 Tax=Corynebacterium sp. TaxID=1720 RepID=UPI0026DEF3C3|nr:ATP-binding protein [Corynebacterium sp.]MDO5670010.1 ATP-binding protein [Corynebacterium sp.]
MVNPLRNPFRPSFGVSPTVLAGRSTLVDAFSLGLAEGIGSPFRTLILSGARGIGKTVLLNELEDTAQSQGWVPVRAYPGIGMVDTLTDTTLPHIAEELEGPSGKRMLTGMSLAGMGSITSVADPSHSAPTPTLITRLRHVAGLLRDRGSGILITLDELQSADPQDQHVLATAVQDLMRDNYDIAFAAAGLPAGVDKLLQQEGTTFLRRAHRVDLTVVSEDEARILFVDTAQSGGRAMTADAVDAAVSLSAGYPYLMQVVGSLSWARANQEKSNQITSHHIGSIRDSAVERIGIQIHGPSFRDVPDQQLGLLYALAELSPAGEPVRTGAIAEHLGVPANALSMARKALLERSLVIVPSYGFLQFALPFAADHLLSNPSLRP